MAFHALRVRVFSCPTRQTTSFIAKYVLPELGFPGRSGSFYSSRYCMSIQKHMRLGLLQLPPRHTGTLKNYHEYAKDNPYALFRDSVARAVRDYHAGAKFVS